MIKQIQNFILRLKYQMMLNKLKKETERGLKEAGITMEELERSSAESYIRKEKEYNEFLEHNKGQLKYFTLEEFERMGYLDYCSNSISVRFLNLGLMDYLQIAITDSEFEEITRSKEKFKT